MIARGCGVWSGLERFYPVGGMNYYSCGNGRLNKYLYGELIIMQTREIEKSPRAETGCWFQMA